MFGGFERKGKWVVPPSLKAVCVFGGGQLDLTQAQLTSQETVITVFCMFGGLEVIVPEGVVVRNGVVAIFGGHTSPESVAREGAPVIRLEGAVLFGGVDTHRPKPPKRDKKRSIER